MPEMRCIRHLRDYIALPSVNPMRRHDLPADIVGEARYAAHVRDQLRALDVDAELIGPADRPSVVAELRVPGARDTVLTLCGELGTPVEEQDVPGEMLYLADEVFFVGTAAEVTPLRTIDRIPVGNGKRGPITERIQQEFFAIVEGKKPDRHGWLTPVPATRPAPVGANR